MLARLPRILIALALASSIGLHWTFLQVVAWTGMMISYSQEGPVAEAVSKTFDGNHPCDLCKKIAKGKQSQKQTVYKFEFGKVKFSCAPEAFIFVPPSAFWLILAPNEGANLLTHPPLVPPPRIFES